MPLLNKYLNCELTFRGFIHQKHRTHHELGLTDREAGRALAQELGTCAMTVWGHMTGVHTHRKIKGADVTRRR